MAPTRDARGRFARRPIEDLSPAYARRIARGDSENKSRAEARGHGTRPTDVRLSRDAFGTEPYERSLQVLRLMRAGESLTAAARAEGVSPDTVLRQVGTALERDGRRWRVRPVDRLYREMQYLTPQGYEYVAPRDSREATKLAEYYNAVDSYLRRGDERALRRFRRMKLRTADGTSLPFVTDLDDIDRLAAAGVPHFVSIYRLVA